MKQISIPCVLLFIIMIKYFILFLYMQTRSKENLSISKLSSFDRISFILAQNLENILFVQWFLYHVIYHKWISHYLFRVNGNKTNYDSGITFKQIISPQKCK